MKRRNSLAAGIDWIFVLAPFAIGALLWLAILLFGFGA